MLQKHSNEFNNNTQGINVLNSVLKAVGFRAASTASASASDCRYFISSYPTHEIGSALRLQNPAAGVPGATYAKCQTNSSKRLPVSVGIAIGNNFRLADRIVETVLKFKRMKKEKGDIMPWLTHA